MAKIRHIAIKVEDQEKAANFYKQTFGMTEAWRGPVRDDGNRAIYLDRRLYQHGGAAGARRA